MDNATHAFTGMLLADATAAWIERRTGQPPAKRLRRTIVAVGVIAAELPDADLAYAGPLTGLGKLGYLLHHRGHTHTVLFAAVGALLLWWVAAAINRRTALLSGARWPLLVLAFIGTLSHLLLDYTNSYGVHPFWPVNNRWYYGDAVFIVEPWLWVVAIPPLLFGPRQRWSRALLAVLLCAILGASFFSNAMSSAWATLVTVSAAAWLVAQRFVPAGRRLVMAALAFGTVEVTFALSSVRARTAVRSASAANEQVVDIVLAPNAANPFCFDVFAIALTDSSYTVRSGTVAPWSPAVRTSASASRSCRANAARRRFHSLRGESTPPPPRGGVVWIEQWSAPRGELAALAQAHCEVALALRFMRVPVWQVSADASVLLSDARFGVGLGGFSDVRATTAECPVRPHAWIPPWTPPREATLRMQGPR